jgi:hypothetical protein
LTRPTLLLPKLAAWRPRGRWAILFCLQLGCLALQWITIQATPLVFHKANGKGWYAVCIGVKEP